MFALHPFGPGLPAVALGVGLLVGIDRERHKGRRPDTPRRRSTHVHARGAARRSRHGSGRRRALATAGPAVAGFAALSCWRARDQDPGLTTETALVVTTLIGGLAIREFAWPPASASSSPVLLVARSELHRFTRSVLTDDTSCAACWSSPAPRWSFCRCCPIIPIGPYGALNLRTVWWS